MYAMFSSTERTATILIVHKGESIYAGHRPTNRWIRRQAYKQMDRSQTYKQMDRVTYEQMDRVTDIKTDG